MPTQFLLRLLCFADIDAEKRVDESLVQTWKLKFGHQVIFFVQTFSIRFGQILKLRIRRDFEAEDFEDSEDEI